MSTSMGPVTLRSIYDVVSAPVFHRPHRDRIRRLLLAAVKRHTTDRQIVDLLSDIEVDDLVRLARRHRIAPLLHQRLGVIGHDVSPTLLRQLRHDHLEARARQLQAHAAIGALQQALEVPFLVVKGAALAARWYDDGVARSSVDVDVLVRRADFRAAATQLTDAGFDHLLGSWQGLLDAGMAEVPLAHRGCTIDLHWHLIARAAPRREIDLHEDAIFARARPVTIGAVDAATLDDEDTLLHLCVHSGLDGGRRLYQLVDVDRVVRSDRVDWERFVGRARAAGAHALCAAILQRCHHLVATPLPHGLLDRLSPFSGWLEANRCVDRHRRPDCRLYNGIASGILLAGGRSTPVSTLRSVARAVVEAVDGAPETVAHRERRSSGHPSAVDSSQRYLDWVDRGPPAAVGR